MLKQASNMNGTGTQTHARVIFVRSLSTASQEIEVTPSNCLYIIAIMRLGFIYRVARC